MKNIRLLTILLAMILFMSSNASSAEESVQLFMADGQLKSHPIRVFITKDIADSVSPKLMLKGSHAISKKNAAEDLLIKPLLIARKQESEQIINENKVILTGTLLLFDLSHYPIPGYKTAMRLTPTLIWGEEGQFVAIGTHEIYLVNPVPAFIWPFAMVIFLVLIIIGMARHGKRRSIQFICNKEGNLSLARTQVALWTIVIGGMITAYGFMRLDVPEIPLSLVALMGLSLATGGISYTQSVKKKNIESVAFKNELPASVAGHQISIADLVIVPNEEGKAVLSLARAQMVFWTVLTLFLFIVKSILDGNLWAVPWELVALMGLSQVGYLAPKIPLKP